MTQSHGATAGPFARHVRRAASVRSPARTPCGGIRAGGFLLPWNWHETVMKIHIRAALLLAFLLAACDGGSSTGAPTASFRLILPTPTLELEAGDEATLQPVVQDAGGGAVQAQVEWTVSAPEVVAVDRDGRVSALQPGAATVTAAYRGATATASVTVHPHAVARVVVTPPADTLAFIGETVRLAAQAFTSRGKPAASAFAWTSLDPQVATVDGGGLAVSAAPGVARIVATASGAADTAMIHVIPTVAALVLTPAAATLAPGGSVALQASPRDAGGTVVQGSTVAWVSSAPAVATVDAAGVVRGVAPGSASVTATSGAATAAAQVTVQAAAIATLEVSPASATVDVGGTVGLVPVARDATGNVLTGRPVAWSTSNAAVATVTSGQVRGVAGGTAAITVTAEGKTATAQVTVRAPVASVSVEPATATVDAGATVTLRAVARDGAGNVLSGRPVTWVSSAPAVATVASSGVVTGVSAGTASVYATVEGRTGSAQVTVRAPSVPAAGTPVPQAGDVVFLDTRAGGAHSIQASAVTTLQQALAAGAPANLGAGASGYTGPGALGFGRVDFTTDVDGRGTHAFRFNWTRAAGNPGGCGGKEDADPANDGTYNAVSQHTQYLRFDPLLNGPGREVYLTYRLWAGRTATGGGTGQDAVGTFDHQSLTGGHKMLVWFRRNATGTGSTSAGRITATAGDGTRGVELHWQGEEGGSPSVPDQYSNPAFDLNQYRNQVVTVAYRFRAESALGARDGIVQQWMNGRLVLDLRNAGSAHTGWSAAQIGGPTWICVPQDQTMYVWDVVAWRTN